MSDEVKALEARVAALEKFVETLKRAIGGKPEAEVADDAELDSHMGDPRVRKDPTERYWRGDSFVGRTLSACTPEYLDAWAKYKDTCAVMNEKSGEQSKLKYAGYDRKDAARARGWAKRLRAGWKPSARANGTVDDSYGHGDAWSGDDEPGF